MKQTNQFLRLLVNSLNVYVVEHDSIKLCY